MTIGELTVRTGCTTETIRFYEGEGLPQPLLRAANTYREYGVHHLDRVARSVPVLMMYIGRMRVGMGHHLVSVTMAMATNRHHSVGV